MGRRTCGCHQRAFPNQRVAIELLDGDARKELEKRQISVSFGQDVIEHARCIKTEEEQKAQARSAFVCETGLARLKGITRPGITENEFWATSGAINASLGGDYVETRLLVSGERTNPWYSEAARNPFRMESLWHSTRT
jgi:Xaa-Pro aminopeptidase